jgi:hypothetical protein
MHPREIRSHPRYRDDPVFYFVEQVVVDTIEGLPMEQQQRIAETIEVDVSGWRAKVKELAVLSDTFEIAVLDLWYRNSRIAAERGDALTAHDFSLLFVDNYYLDDSQIDVWGPGALESAKSRVAEAQALESRRRQ